MQYFGVYWRDKTGAAVLCEVDGGICYEAHRTEKAARKRARESGPSYFVQPVPAGTLVMDLKTEQPTLAGGVQAAAHVAAYHAKESVRLRDRARQDEEDGADWEACLDVRCMARGHENHAAAYADSARARRHAKGEAPMRRPSERAYYVARRFVRRFGANAANERSMSLHWRMVRIARSGQSVDDYLPTFRWLANYRGELLRLARETA